MKTLFRLGFLVLLLSSVHPAIQAQKVSHNDQDVAAITRAMDKSASDWNKGDIRGFMDCYVNSPDTTFVGKTVTHGWQQVLDRYLKNYGTPETMGHLDFSDLQVRVLDERTAVATGRFKLTRTAAGGGDASGIYSLVFLKTAQGWKITLDHTVSD
jgi:ketosteroid isomerase-like protein